VKYRFKMAKTDKILNNSLFPKVDWEKMDFCKKKYFRELSEDLLKSRWTTEEGKKLKAKIIETNMKYGNSNEYLKFIGTIKSDLSKKKPKIDLRGINFSGFDYIINEELIHLDFSNCNLKYSNFSNSIIEDSRFCSSDILYSDFSHSFLDGCDFSKSNLTLTDFSESSLCRSNFKNAWINDVNFNEARLSYIKFNNKLDFVDLDISKLNGVSDYNFLTFIKRKSKLKHLKSKGFFNKIIYHIWQITCGFGYSFTRWLLFSSLIAFIFGCVYSANIDSFNIDEPNSKFTYFYFSIVTFTTLGFGDIHPIDFKGEILVSIQVIIGYLMLGGLISILANKIVLKE